MNGLRCSVLRVGGGLRLGMGNLARQQKKDRDKYCAAHSKHLARFRRESATQGRGEVNEREVERSEERTASIGCPTWGAGNEVSRVYGITTMIVASLRR